MKRKAHLFWTTAAALIAGTGTAGAESYCVACYGPEAVYRCVIAGVPATGAPDPRNQMQCIKQIATSGGHARCSVERFSVTDCQGTEKVISADAAIPIKKPSNPGLEASERAAPPDASNTTKSEPVSTPPQPPRTVEELAKSAAANTKDGLSEVGGTVKSTTEKAGEQISGIGSAVGKAAQKSWHCLTSLFSDC
jgi:hypothetical protein